MKYIGEFRSLEDQKYKLEIITNSDSTSITNLDMVGEDQAVIKYEGDDTLYKPVKYSSATFKFLTEDYYFDMYGETATQDSVILYDENNNNILWTGYTTPNIYNNGYEYAIESMELECIDGLSTLQYIDYTTIGSSKDIICILDILKNILSKCKCYSKLYISASMSYNSTSVSECLLSKCFINEQNWFDEDNKASKCDQVLEQISKFFNLTTYSDGINIYMMDYDAIKRGNNNYFTYNINLSDTSSSTVSLNSPSILITKDLYQGNGQTISLDNIYNKVIVKDSLYSYDTVLPEIYSNSALTNWKGDWNGYDIWYYDPNTSDDGGNKVYFIKYYKSDDYKCHMYDYTTGDIWNEATITNYSQVSATYRGNYNYNGCLLTRQAFYANKTKKEARYLSSIDYENVLVFTWLPAKSQIDECLANYDKIKNNVYFEINPEKSLNQLLGGGDNNYLVIDCMAAWQRQSYYPIFVTGDTERGATVATHGDVYVRAILQIGDYYYNNDNYDWDTLSGDYWTKTPCVFKIMFGDAKNTDDIYLTDYKSIRSNITYKLDINDGTGYAIKMDKTIKGKVIFKILAPTLPWKNKYFEADDGNYQYYNYTFMFIKNLTLKSAIGYSINTEYKDYKSDTEYSNIIDNNFVNELDTDDWKICTWDNKKPNYSCIAYSDDSNLSMLDKVYDNSDNSYHREEEHYIKKLVNQYSTPSIILNLNLKNVIPLNSIVTDIHQEGKSFVVDSQEINYGKDSTDIKLIEKK